MAQKQNVGFWRSVFPNQLGNFCFLLFLIGLTAFGLFAFFRVNIFEPDGFKSMDKRIPALGTHRVVDESGVLDSGEIDALTRQIDAFEAASGGQMAVLLIRSLCGDSIEDFSLAVAEKWKVGWKGKDNGVVLVLAIQDRRSRLEIGYGYEGVINDARAGDILRDMAPYMRRGQYEQAISFAIASVAAFVLDEKPPEGPGISDDDGSEGGNASFPLDSMDLLFMFLLASIFFEIFGTLFAWLLLAPSVKQSFGLVAMIVIGGFLWKVLFAVIQIGQGGGGGRGGGGGGGRSGGGGGSFGGGGASGRW